MSQDDRRDELVQSMQRGDRAAFDQLVEHDTPYLLNYARAECSRYNAHDAVPISPEEAVQETWATAWVKRDQFEGETHGQFMGWVKAILQNLVCDYYKSAGIRRRRDVPGSTLPSVQASAGFDVPEGDAQASDPLDRLAGDVTPASRQARREDTKERLAAAVAALPEWERNVVTLLYLENRPVKEVSTLLECSIFRVYAARDRALAMLEGDIGGLSRNSVAGRTTGPV